MVMLWCILLLLLSRAPASESRLFPASEFQQVQASSNDIEAHGEEAVRSSSLVSRSLVLNNLGKGSPPKSPSGGTHSIGEKKTRRSPPSGSHEQTSASQPFQRNAILHNLGKRSPPSSPSPGTHGIVVTSAHRSTPAAESEFMNKLGRGSPPSAPSGGSHMGRYVRRSPPAPPTLQELQSF
ncbi:hypothetical protein R1flu_011350 [Riccia fluitans]|uniref:Uncharacterized protein n=1 Tax=Riccia fluitans TaxID=41844 RepID=A0ABD1Z7R6_9MARC